jgi:plastocyanin
VFDEAMNFQRLREVRPTSSAAFRGLGRAGLVVGMLASAMVVPASASAAQTLTISAGAESPGGDVQLNIFAPNEITLNVGDTLTWSLDSTGSTTVPDGTPSPVHQPGRRAGQSQVALPVAAATTTAACRETAAC